MQVKKVKKILQNSREILLAERSKRISPQLDDKIILGWNALMNTACSKAFGATGDQKYRQLAIDNMQFLLANFKSPFANEFHHTWKNDIAKFPAFLDDYAYLIQALIHLQEITADKNWLLHAKAITEIVLNNFSESGTDLLFYTTVSQTDVIFRKKEVYDGAIPSGNSVMAYNLHHLSILFDKKEWEQKSENMIASLGSAITRYPISFGNWACLLQELIAGTNEIALVGIDFSNTHTAVLKEYIPHKVIMASSTDDAEFALLSGKPVTNTTTIYLCRNYTCKNPVISAKELISLINSTPGR